MKAGERGRLWKALLLALLALFLLTGIGHATECLITVNTSDTDQMYPDISGNVIVWQDGRDGLIHSYDIVAGTESTVSRGPRLQSSPVISGPLVAWRESSTPGVYEIILYDLLTSTSRTLSTEGGPPTIFGDQVVWINQPGTLKNLFLYNTTTGLQNSPVKEPPNDRTTPAISDGWLAWMNASQSRIYAKNLTTGEEINASLGLTTRLRTNPVLSGSRLVWQDQHGTPSYDIFINNLTGARTPQMISSGGGSKINPDIDDLRIVWMKNPNIYLYDLAGSGAEVPISSTPQNDLPRISGDRVVWQSKEPGKNLDILLYTIGSSQACPEASFTANPSSGAAPLTVGFTDTSTGSPAHWSWDFGDGTTSSDQNPSHTYTADGSYSVTLTVGSAVGRNYTSVTDAVRVGPIPIVSFSANQSYGVAPLTVRFTDTSSGDPTSWAWDLGDGSQSVNQNQVIHTYTNPGIYFVSLSATNMNGTGTGTPRSFTVLNGLESRAATDFDWLLVDTTGSAQSIILDTTRISGLAFDPTGDPTRLSFTPPPLTGWKRMTFSSADPAGFILFPDGTIRGSLGASTLESEELVPASFGTGIGNPLPVSYQVSFSGYPVHGEVNATVWEGMLPDDEAATRLALAMSRNFTSLIGGAYTVSLVTTGTAPVTGAGLNLSVSSAWVTANGNQNNIAAARLRDSGANEILVPASVFSDAATGLDHYTVPSPGGASRFVLVSATGSSNLIQMGARVATQVIQSSLGSGSRGYGSSDQPAVRDRPPWEQPAAVAQPPAAPAVPTFYGEGRIDTTVAGITREAVKVSAEDHGVQILIPAGIEAFDAGKTPLTQVSVNSPPPGGVPSGTGLGSPGFTGIAYDLGPDGATFNPPATLTFTIPEASWTDEALYTIRTYDTGTGAWTDIPTKADPATRTLTGQVSHLCLFGIFAAPLPAASTPASSDAAVTASQPAPTVPSLPRTPMGTFTGLLGWVYATAVANPRAGALVLVIAVLLSTVFIARKRRSRITRIRRKR